MQRNVCAVESVIPYVIPERYKLMELQFTNMTDSEFFEIAKAAVIDGNDGNPDAAHLISEYFRLAAIRREAKWRWLNENRDMLVFKCDIVDRGWAIEIEFSVYYNTPNEPEPKIIFIEYFETYRQLKNKMKYFHLDRSKMIVRKTFRNLCYD